MRKMCKALGMPQCSYYQWSRQESKRNQRRQREAALVQTVRSVFEEYFCIYGCTKLLRELNDRSVDINEYKLRRIMRENGLYSVVVKKFKPYRPGKSDGMYAQNLLQRNFAPFGLNQYWCGDITYIRTNLGWVYLAVVLDLFNKEVIGYAISKNIDTELVKEALGNAVVNRGKHENLVFHSDRGTQYSSRGYRNMLNDFGIEPSMSAPGCPYDNAAMESFFASLKKELIYRRTYAGMDEVREDIFKYIELFYNRKRLHSSLGYMSPVAYRLQKLSA
ncbi:IS3 family transposase [Fibrobacter sp. UWEL]|uniref:IS3 family transposase n=1 Tax=Fibrobacter sp. UWEL TaxID=1896209 RepID=UPI0009214B0D|nr:IS3 family transposase [Fibrobacter sp. UWEL]SHL56518.1 Transposase InsO and inactivated derivatives [Fibrobacter sp. UWEL]